MLEFAFYPPGTYPSGGQIVEEPTYQPIATREITSLPDKGCFLSKGVPCSECPVNPDYCELYETSFGVDKGEGRAAWRKGIQVRGLTRMFTEGKRGRVARALGKSHA